MKSTSAFIAAALAFGVIGTASAQSNGLSGFSARVGVFYPTADSARQISRTWFGAGLDYKLRDLSSLSSDTYKASLGISIDFYNRDDFRVVPVLATYTGNLSDRFYYIGGAGVAFTRIPTGNTVDERARFAYMFGLGYNLAQGPNPIFVEARFFGNDKTQANGFGLYAGIRF
ncbi:MAG: hypothetical protein SFX74_08255 [Fimbriimonadaceae bacterium]|nr:hypothetical protein [Fimbriimonadaceae bacterium]